MKITPQHAKKPPNPKITTKERYAKYTKTAIEVQKEHPHMNKNSVADEVISRLRQIDKIWIQTPQGTDVKSETILKHFRMIKG